jgi:hopanoid biosynthesis associated protein HpnK
MGHPEVARRLIVNADDFGRSAAVNAAIERAHREGVLTSASLMVNGAAFDEAVAIARANPRLGIGLHLTLCSGHATLPPREIPGLVDAGGQFADHAVAAGCRYFFRRSLRGSLRREIAAQFAKFKATSLALDHVNGHLNLHLHPTVLAVLLESVEEWNISALRVTRDPFWLNSRLATGAWCYRASHALIFWLLSARAVSPLRRCGVRHTRCVFGLLQNGRMDEAFLLRLLPCLPAGDSELYSHPSLDGSCAELDALVSPRVKALVEREQIKLVRYQDLV